MEWSTYLLGYTIGARPHRPLVMSQSGTFTGGLSMSRNLFYALALASSLSLVACGGSMSPSPLSNGVPMSLTIGDTPPSGVAVLFLETLITGPNLHPPHMTHPAAPLPPTPPHAQLPHL